MSKLACVVLIIFASLFIVSCVSLQSLDNIRSSGDYRVERSAFTYPKEVVYKTIKNVIGELKLTIISENKEEGVIYAKSSLKMNKLLFSDNTMGKYVAVYIKPISQNATSVEVVQKSYFPEISSADLRNIIINKTKARLE